MDIDDNAFELEALVNKHNTVSNQKVKEMKIRKINVSPNKTSSFISWIRNILGCFVSRFIRSQQLLKLGKYFQCVY